MRYPEDRRGLVTLTHNASTLSEVPGQKKPRASPRSLGALRLIALEWSERGNGVIQVSRAGSAVTPLVGGNNAKQRLVGYSRC